MTDRISVRITDLLELVDPKAENEVNELKRTLNRPIRDFLRHECALTLMANPTEERSGSRASDRIRVPVRVLPGYPTLLEDLSFGDLDRVSFLLQPWRVRLRSGQAAVRDLLPIIGCLEREPAANRLAREGGDLLPSSADYLRKLNGLLGDVDPIARILAVDQDIMGVYGIDQESKKPLWLLPIEDTRVALYWAVIALIASDLGFPTGTLAAIVLVHELAHAYTHLGTDIEGHSWTSEEFFKTDRFVLEGLAQYYTGRVCDRLESRVPGIRKTFDRLCAAQAPPYRVHQRWEQQYSPEVVRFAMLKVRRMGAVTLSEMNEALTVAGRTIRANR